MKTLIYKITNPINEIYIGSTDRKLSERKAEHKYSIKRNRKGLIYDSFNKYGFKNHTFEIVSVLEIEKDKELEHFIIQTFNPKLNLVKEYNATANNKFWVNDSVKEFQIYETDFKDYKNLNKGRLITPFKKI